jgi:ribosome-binding ATPase YchF (GTP1/OBG family)
MNEIRQAILSNCRSNWLKVARVVHMAREQCSLTDCNESYELVGQELTKLVEDGELESVGDLSNWRRSEVRLPTS